MRMRTIKAWSLAALMALGGGMVPVSAQQTFSLSWNANPEPDVVSYRVHVGTVSRQYSQSFSTAAPSIDISDLPSGPTYFFAVTAVNSAGLESDFSAEISSAGAPSGPVVNSRLTATSIRLTVNAPAGSTVTFESSINLQDWAVYANRVANTQGVATFNESRSGAQPMRFFRARTQ